MSSSRSRRPTIVDRLRKLLKPTKPSTPLRSPASPSSVSVAVKSPPAPAPRLFSLENRSEHQIVCKRSFVRANASSVSLGRLPSQAKGAQPWYIPNETTIFPLPAPRHPAFRPQPETPTTSCHGHVRPRAPSLSMSASSHGTSDLHTPNSPLARPQLALWIPTSGTIDPDYGQRVPTGCRDGIYFDLPDEDGEPREEPESAPVRSGAAVDHDTARDRGSGEHVDVGLGKAPTLLPLEIRSSMWIRNEVAGIQDDETRRLATLAFL